jgi:hypothetical protein
MALSLSKGGTEFVPWARAGRGYTNGQSLCIIPFVNRPSVLTVCPSRPEH